MNEYLDEPQLNDRLESEREEAYTDGYDAGYADGTADTVVALAGNLEGKEKVDGTTTPT